MRILGVDLGKARVGIALSDPLGITAQPIEVIHRKKQDYLQRIKQLVEEHEVEKLVVGRPLQLNGTEGPASQQVDVWIKEIEGATGKVVIAWDERLSTAQAERVMIEGGARRDKRKQAIDKVAATLILQSYLDAQV